jgi:sugar phosphate isomerase/epimerase
MRFCFSTLVCPTWSFPQIVGAAAAHGLEGIDLRGIGAEIDITRLAAFNEELDATLALLRQHGLSVPCLNTSIALVTPVNDRWDMMLDECRRYARVAGRAGTPFLRVFGGQVIKGMTRSEATAMAKRHLRQLQHICTPHRCRVLLETHDDWATGEQVLELLGDTTPEEAGVLWDIEDPCRRGEAPGQTAQNLSKHILHVHIKDSTRINGASRPSLLGQGNLPLKQFVQALKAIAYDRWICLETEKRWHPEVAPEPEESLPQFVQYMKANWAC